MLSRTFLVCFCLTGVPAIGASAESDRIDFNRDIRPILSDNCYLCHGPDEANRKGGLRLDHRARAIAPGDSGQAAISLGKPEASELIRRITSSVGWKTG